MRGFKNETEYPIKNEIYYLISDKYNRVTMR
jgi:hypothetical protein